MWILLFITSGLTLWCVEETGGPEGEGVSSLCWLPPQNLLQLLACTVWKKGDDKKKETVVEGENEKNTHREPI